MKQGLTLTAITLGFFISSEAGVAKEPTMYICPSNEVPCQNGQCCPSSVVHLEAEPGTGYVLPKKLAFRCEKGLKPVLKSNDFFVCEPTEPQKSEPEEKSEKQPGHG